jgi:hypothetical protein
MVSERDWAAWVQKAENDWKMAKRACGKTACNGAVFINKARSPSGCGNSPGSAGIYAPLAGFVRKKSEIWGGKSLAQCWMFG